MFSWHRVFTFGVVVTLAEISSLVAAPPSFRVDTDIFVGDSAKPARQNITLFHQGVCFDFASDDSLAVMIVDAGQGRITLLDPHRRIKAPIETAELSRWLTEARKEAEQSELAKVLAPATEVKINEQTGAVHVGGPQFSYQASLQSPPDAEMARQYANFADWSARLSAMYPPHFPPYVRLALNRAITEKGMLPAELTRTIQQNGQSSQVRCRLHPSWQLNSDDHSKIASAQQMLADFKEVSAKEYFSQPLISVRRSDTVGKK